MEFAFATRGRSVEICFEISVGESLEGLGELRSAETHAERVFSLLYLVLVFVDVGEGGIERMGHTGLHLS